MLRYVAALAALAQTMSPPTTDVRGTDPRTIKVELELGRRDGDDSSESRTRRRAQPVQARPKPVTRILDVELRVDPVTGKRCAYVFSIPGDPESRDAINNELQSLRWVGQYGLCSNSPERPAANTRPSAAAAALQAWRESVTLPDPVPRIAPGWALTGKRAYLEVGGDDSQRGTFNAFGYDVEIVATATKIDVDWGDGTVERGLTTEPGPWPTGQISHVYQYATPVTVRVTRTWTARWRIGDATGTVTEPLSTTATLELPVHELEAVRNR